MTMFKLCEHKLKLFLKCIKKAKPTGVNFFQLISFHRVTTLSVKKKTIPSEKYCFLRNNVKSLNQLRFKTTKFVYNFM